MNQRFLTLFACMASFWCTAQDKPYVSKVWTADLGNGYYHNPILDADYSDPDVCRVGEDYYMTASSFNSVPGLPILHSKDLVNWRLIGHALLRQLPFEHFSKTQHGNGVWAPAIRYHQNEFYLYYPDPDFGIYLTKAKNPDGPWSAPVLLEEGKGLIDPCPFWDEDGKAYLVHAYAGSRAGIKSILVLKKLSKDGKKVLDEGKIVYDGHVIDPTIEGPKLYKRNGYYYIFAPAGGVSTGWQLILRSRSIYGPYERYVAIDQGNTSINGPHQGAWVRTSMGEDWFLHFQDKGAYGRVVHLQPMKWVNNWPVIGFDADGDGKGEPVLSYKKPIVKQPSMIQTPAESDEFDDDKLGLQWQWQANPKAVWSFLNASSGKLRLYTHQLPDSAANHWPVPHLLLQKLPTEEFTATTKFDFYPNPKLQSEKAGLIMMGQSYAYLAVKSTVSGLLITYSTCLQANKGKPEKETVLDTLHGNSLCIRVNVKKGAVCTFAYSTDGHYFKEVPETFQIEPGIWVGAKMGIFATRISSTNDSGYADFDWFRVGN
jgi:beta-xylosidase